jgi:hypothetical protein
MTKCKLCNVEISDGSEYCDNCLKNNKEKQSESYLDSLLNSVVHNNNANQSVTNINNNAIIGDIKSTGLKQDNKNSSEFKLDKTLENEEYKYEESFHEELNHEELNHEELNHEEIYQEESNNDNVNHEKPNHEMTNHIENNYEENDENNFDVNQNDVNQNEKNNYDENNNDVDNYDKNNFNDDQYKVNNENNYNESLINNKEQNNFWNTIAEDYDTNTNKNELNNQEPEEFEESTDDDLMALLDMITGLEKSDSKNFNEIKFEEDNNSLPTNDSVDTNDLHEENNFFNKNESKSKDDLYIVEDDTIHFINDLDFNGSDTENNLMYDSKTTDGIDAIDDLNYNDDINALDDLNSLKEINSFNDLSSLNKSDSSDEHNSDSNINSSSDIISIDDFIDDKLNDINQKSSKSSNFGDVYSDSLRAVDSLDDIDVPVDLNKSKIKKKSIFQTIFGTLKIKKSKKEEPFNENNDSSNNSEDIKINNVKKNDKLDAKKNNKLNAKKNNKFNAKKKDKLNSKQNENRNENQNENQNEKLNNKQNDKLTDKKNNKKNAKKNSNKKDNINDSKSKLNKGNTSQSNDDTDDSDVALTDVKKKGKKSAKKNGIKASKEERKASKAEKKAAKADKKAKVPIKKNKDSNIIIDELENADDGKINKVGASILFAICGILAAVVILGTNIYSYSLNIKRAATELDRQRYTEAYKQVYGLKVDASDKELYDKIITVMYVDKELDSYHNYKDMGKYPEALDSLLKGLERYQKYKEAAKSLGIKNDIETIHKQIVTELNNQFNITEKEGMLLINMDDQVDYSNQIFDIATKKLD